MMGSFSEDEKCGFFDAQEDLSSISNSITDSVELFDSKYDVWVQSPGNVKERRSNFLNWMDSWGSEIVRGDSAPGCSEKGVDRIMETSGAGLRNSDFGDEFCPFRSSWGSYDNLDSPEAFSSKEDFVCREGSSDCCSADCYLDEPGMDQKMGDSQKAAVAKEFRNTSGASPSFQQLMHKDSEEATKLIGKIERVKKGWLQRLRSITCIVDKRGESENTEASTCNSDRGARLQRVRVHQCRKRLKELSAVYRGQDIQAHEGSILSMKFSPDGQYLASAGEDGIVRLWKVVEDERSNEHDVPEIDPSCMYFTVNHLSQLTPLFTDTDKMTKVKSPRKQSDSACVIFPPKFFRILEKPVHEFHGHTGEILDLSWSKNKYLLSSSVDKTIRLWQVGYEHCVKVFSHGNYVTSVQFNPIDDNYFISGSIDGIVRVWDIGGCQVIDWTDITEIVTAVCYRPNGQGVIIGSMTSNCRFYAVSENRLQFDAQVCLHNKKKSPCRRITGFQFFPQDDSKIIVSCADSQVKILHGLNVIGKYKGLHSAGNQLSATFTSDGKHIVSTGEDANVYVWNCSRQEELDLFQGKSIRSWERFSANASIAIPWSGLRELDAQDRLQFHNLDVTSPLPAPLSSPACFSLSQEFCSDSFGKGSATWPEEKLHSSNQLGIARALRRSQYKFLRSSCQTTSNSHAWGLVIVTAGRDGKIRSFRNYGLPIHV